MTDLERARAHLLECQRDLYVRRAAPWTRNPSGQQWCRERAEQAFLAALSWVWEEQQRNRNGSRDEGMAITYGPGSYIGSVNPDEICLILKGSKRVLEITEGAG
jgi:hypothetical protein